MCSPCIAMHDCWSGHGALLSAVHVCPMDLPESAPCTYMRLHALFILPSHVSPALPYTLLGTSYDRSPPSPEPPLRPGPPYALHVLSCMIAQVGMESRLVLTEYVHA